MTDLLQKALKQLSQEPKEPIIIAIIGEESLLVTEAVESLRHATLAQAAAPDFNRDEFDGKGLDAGAVVRAAQTLPMMAKLRFVHVRHIDKAKASDSAGLIQYLKAPSITTVFCVSGSKIDMRLKLGKSLGKKCVYAIQGPKERGLGSFIIKRGQQRGTPIDTNAAHLLADLVGPQVGTIDRTLERLALYGGAKEPISVDDVEATVAPTKVHSIFELIDAVGQRKRALASTLLRNAIGGGEAALKVLALIARQFRLLLRAKEVQGGERDIAKALGLPPFLVGSIREQAKHYTHTELRHALAAVGRADVSMKSTRIGHGVILDRLLIEVMT